MSDDDDLADLHFGAAGRFHEDGTFESTGHSDCDSSQMERDKMQPMGAFDREPVVIRPGHPLASGGVDYVHPSACRRTLSPDTLVELAKNLKRTTALVRETADDSRSLVDQSRNSIRFVEQSTASQLQFYREYMDQLEARVRNEVHLTQIFWNNIHHHNQTFMHSTLHIMDLGRQLAELAHHFDDHGAVSATLRRDYSACQAAEKHLERGEMCYRQIRSLQVGQVPAKDRPLSVMLASVLFQVDEVLSRLKNIAPRTFKANSSAVSALSGYVEQTLSRLRALDWAVAGHFPSPEVGTTPAPSQSTPSRTFDQLPSSSGSLSSAWMKEAPP